MQDGEVFCPISDSTFFEFLTGRAHALHIHAALHAAFRWDKARRFTSDDLYDNRHRIKRFLTAI